MKALVLYGSTWNNTRSVVNRLPQLLAFPIDIVDVKTVKDASIFGGYDLLIFFASTAGDQELQADMEQFLARQVIELDSKPYAICELGNYFGYDDFDFGAERILSYFLHAGNGCEVIPPFAMDSFPRKDWSGLARWCNLLNKTVLELPCMMSI
jgi:flavodoxin